MATLLPGTLEMLILRTLTIERMHGYAIAQHIARVSQNALLIEKGSLYPALERLQRQGWVTSRWSESATGRRARYYSITASGRRALGEEVSAFQAMNEAVARVLDPEPEKS
ncbi:MAG TPA: PadR family transcriptional regulator [Vicinamibacterales bacterium]|jgi:transcriptional regulator